MSWRPFGANPFHLALPYSTSPGTTHPLISLPKAQARQLSRGRLWTPPSIPEKGDMGAKDTSLGQQTRPFAAGFLADFG
jgi:hypothetical protein